MGLQQIGTIPSSTLKLAEEDFVTGDVTFNVLRDMETKEIIRINSLRTVENSTFLPGTDVGVKSSSPFYPGRIGRLVSITEANPTGRILLVEFLFPNSVMAIRFSSAEVYPLS